MPDREQISIHIENAGEDHVKVVWIDPDNSRFLPYRLHRTWLAEKAEEVRGALAELGNEYTKPTPHFDAIVGTLMQRGAELRTALFEDYAPEDSSAVSEARHWFSELNSDGGAPVRIIVHADPALPIPWGLLHEGVVTNKGDSYENFWALRHDVVALYNGISPRSRKPVENIRLLTALNQKVFENTTNYLDQDEQNFIIKFLRRAVGIALTSCGCRKRWKEVGDNDCLFHFFGHTSGNELQFSEGDVLTARRFHSLFRRERQGYVLSFLNGCASVSGQGPDSFLAVTAYPGFCGFIGAEAVVPDRFAILFGQELLHCILDEGRSVRETMSLLWRKHRPMGLFYGCYAHPGFRIARADPCSSLPPRFGFPNFLEGSSTGSRP